MNTDAFRFVELVLKIHHVILFLISYNATMLCKYTGTHQWTRSLNQIMVCHLLVTNTFDLLLIGNLTTNLSYFKVNSYDFNSGKCIWSHIQFAMFVLLFNDTGFCEMASLGYKELIPWAGWPKNTHAWRWRPHVSKETG